MQFKSQNSKHSKPQLSSIEPLDRAHQVLPLKAKVDLGGLAMKGCSIFPKLPALLEPYHQII